LLRIHVAICAIKRRSIEGMETFSQNADRMAISAIAFSELYHSAEKSVFVAKKLAVAEAFAGLVEVLPYAAKAAQHQGGIRRALEKAGQPVEPTICTCRVRQQRRAHLGQLQLVRV